jgi:hypothetical protein
VVAPAAGAILSQRVLNRSLLARQGLLERTRRPAIEVLDSLVGMQAQEPGDPYVAMWARIADFDPLELSRLIETRQAARIGLLRGTLHLASAADIRAIYPILEARMRRAFSGSPFAKQLDGVDIEAVRQAARAALEATPQTPTELGATLARTWPDRDPTSLALAARSLLPLVQVPPRGLWQRTGRATNTTAEAWLGTPLDGGSVDDLVRRYLRAFGPATVADIRTWSWLTGLRQVIDRLRPELVTFRDDAGRELVDVADGLLAPEDLPTPVRFLPQYDNVFLAHADRSRILSGGWTMADLFRRGSILVDGFVSATWRVARSPRSAVMTIESAPPITAATRLEVEAEGERLLAFLAPAAESREVRILAPG